MGKDLDWITKNKQLRRELNLPEYDPPQFEDDVFTHIVANRLEEKYNCDIKFVGKDTQYLDDWEVIVDGKPILKVGRHRDGDGNTIYEISSQKFSKKLEKYLKD